MHFNLCGVELLIELLDKEYFDNSLFKEYIKLPQVKAFLKHEKELNRRTNKKIIKEELERVILYSDYEDPYEFYMLKRNIYSLKKSVEYIKANEREIINNALFRVYRFVPNEVPIKPNIYIIAGGCDGGFTAFMKKIYINFGKYIENIEEFEKVLAHELYHSRYLKFYKKAFLILKMSLYTEKAMYETLGRILEEGIACLIQHGLILSKDDPIGTLTSRDLVLYKEHFELLNAALLSIKEKKPDYRLIVKIDVYVIGYIIARVLYEEEGMHILNEWTFNYDYKKPVKKYIETCYKKKVTTGFMKEIEKWLLSI